MSDLTKAVQMVRQARMDSWQRMAQKLPDHHVLAVEMFRVDRDRTVAIFTIVKHGKVVQEVLQGDGRGLNVKPVVPHAPRPFPPLDLGRQFQVEALMMTAPDATTDGDDGSAYSIAVGYPPPKDPPDPGIVAVGGVGLQNSFDTGEIVTGGSTSPP
jgi:hypothetical protein